MSKLRFGRQDRLTQAATIVDIQKAVADVGKSLPQVQHALEEVVEDNMAITRELKKVNDGQDSLRADMVRELDRFRADVAGELLTQALKQHCRELAPYRLAANPGRR